MLEFELVLPAYNEAHSLQSVIFRVSAAALKSSFTPERFQLHLVNNGSTDISKEILIDLKHSELGVWFKVINIEINQGYGHGLWTGLEQTTAPVVGWSHADEQCDPYDAFRAYEHMKNQPAAWGLVKGFREGRDKKNVFVSRIFELLAWLILGLRVHEVNAQPKVFHRELLKTLKNPPKTFAFDLYALFMAVKNGFWIAPIPVNFSQRAHGLSKWSATLLGRSKTIGGMIFYMFNLVFQEGRLCGK